jgi:disulfide bond formation protein DsbB
VRTIYDLPLMPRLGYALGFLACAGLLGFAYYLQYYQGQDPCPLCILQRVAFLALAVIFLVAAVHGPARIGALVYSGLLVTAASIGAALAARHVWLQHLPRSQVPECGPGLEYLVKQLPLTRALEKILSGSGECAEVGWTFLGLSIAGWSLLWFVLFGGFAMYLALAAMRRARPRQ